MGSSEARRKKHARYNSKISDANLEREKKAKRARSREREGRLSKV